MTTDELVAAIRRRDERALGQLYDRFGPLVYSFVLRMTSDPGVAEEITLDAFLHVWDQADRVPQGTLIQSWLFTVARSRTIDRLRAARASKRTPVENVGDPEMLPTPEEMAHLNQQRDLVRRAMSELTPPQRIVLELAYYEGLSHSEIAARLGEPLGTVKTRIRQAMQALRKALQPVLPVSS